MTNFWKRSLSMFMALAMVFSLLPMNVFAEEGTTPEETHVHAYMDGACECGATEPVATETPETEAPETEAPETEAPTDAPIALIDETETVNVSFDLSGTNWSRAAAYGLASDGEPRQFDFVKTEGGVCYFAVDEYFPLSPEDIQKISFCEYAGGAYTDYVTFENGKTYTANDFIITNETITVYWNNSDLKLRDGGLVEISCTHGGYMGPNSTHAGGWAVAKSVNGDIYEFELPACVQNCLIWFKVEGEIYEVECIAEDGAYYPSAPSEPEVTNVAQIGETGYATLADAIAAATAGQTIELIADVNENVTIDKNLTIDGKKAVTYALRMSDAENFNYTGVMTVNPGLTVTVENVDFVGGRIAKTTKSTNGTYTIKNCTFDGNGTEPYAFSFKGAKAITIEDCTVKNFAYSFLYVPNAATTVSVKNVTVEDCPNYAVKFGSGVTNATFEDLTVKNTVSGFVINNSANREITVKNCTMVDVTDAISETGGTKTVTCTVLGENNFGAATSSENAKYVLTEGAALTAPTGAKVTNEAGEDVKYINGQYLPVTGVAMVGTQGYETLTDAIAAATAGQTITFLSDIIEDVTVTKAVTIDGADFTYTGKMNLKADTTIKNVNFDGKGYDGYAVETRGANYLTIEDCTAKNYGYGFVQLPSATVLTTIKNVVVSDVNYGVKIDYSNAVVIENAKIDAAVAAVLNSNYGGKTVTIKDSELSILGTWTRNDTIETTFLFEGANTVDQFVIDANLDSFELAAGATLTAPNDVTVITNVADREVAYNNGTYSVVEIARVAAIGDAQYKTLSAAIAAATAGQTITFLSDIAEDVTIDKNLTIDGAGFNYTGVMAANANLTVTVENVDFVQGRFAKTTKSTNGNYTIKNCTFDGKGTEFYALNFKGAKTVTIEDCVVKNYYYSFLYVNSSATNVSVKNVTVENCPDYAVYFSSGVTNATFENLTVVNSEDGFVINNAANRAFTIKNCKMTGVTNAVKHAGSTNTITCTVLGNENDFGTATSSEYAKFVLSGETATLTAPAGATVTTDVADREAVYSNGVYGVAEIVRVAQVGENQYRTLADAIAAAQAGDTITFLSDITEDVTIDKNVTIDGANFDYTGKMTLNKVNVTIENVDFVKGAIYKNKKTGVGGNITIQSCTFDGQGLNDYAVNLGGTNNVVIENVTAKSYGYGFLQLPASNVSLSAKDVTVSDVNYGFKVDYSNGVTMENVTVKDAKYYGIYDSNFGTKTYTISNSNISSIEIWERSAAKTTTFNFVGANTVGALENSEYANYVLAAEDATLAASADVTVTTSVENRVVDYIDGVYMVVNEIVRVAQIGETKYRTLAAAIAAAQAGDTITLLADITEDVTIDKNLTIDGANFDYTGKMTLNKVNVTIENVDFVKGAIYKNKKTGVGGNITIQSCTFDGQGLNDYAVNLGGTNNVVIENVTAKSYGYGFLQLPASNVSLSAKDVTVSDVNYGFKVDYSNAVIMENVTVTNAAYYGIYDSNYGTKTYTISNSNISSIEIWERSAAKTTTFNFVGANTVGTLSSSEYAKYVLTAEDATLEASADAAVTTNVEGCEVEYNDGVYTVVKFVRVAQIGETQYKTLSAAIAAAQAGDTITFLSDITEDVTVNKAVTINGAGFNYTGLMTVSAGQTITVENVDFVGGRIVKDTKSTTGTYTIKNCTFDGNGTEYYALNFKGAKTVTIEDCVVKNYHYSFLYVTSSTTNVSVKNVIVENCPDYAVYFSSGVANATFENMTVVGSEDGFVINNTANRAFTIKNCKLTGATIAVKTNKGTGTVTCTVLGNENDFGNATNSEYAKYVLAAEDATLTALADQNVISGVEGKVVSYQDGTYMLAEPVAQVGETGYATLADAVAAAENGETVVILKDHALNGSKTIVEETHGYDALVYVNGKDITLDFNGKTIEVTPAHDNMLESVVFVGNGAKLTVKGNGGFKVNECDNLYSLFYNSNSTLVIESGNFYVAKTVVIGSVIYADKENDTTINGGVFTLVNAGENSDTTKPWIFNVHGKNEGNFVKITGGYFNQNPQLNLGTQKDCEVTIAEDRMFTLVTEGEYANYYTLSNAVAHNINTNVSYATIDEAVTAAKSGETVKVVADCTAEGVIILMKGRTLDLNGHIVTAEAAVGFNSSNIVDNSAAKTARLVVDQDSFSVSSTNKQMPIWNGVDGYVFRTVVCKTQNTGVQTKERIYVIFRPVFDSKVNALLADGAEDNGIQIKVRVSWDDPEMTTVRKSQDFVYVEDMIKSVYSSNKGFSLTLVGLEELKNITLDVIVESNLGVVSRSRVVTLMES